MQNIRTGHAYIVVLAAMLFLSAPVAAQDTKADMQALKDEVTSQEEAVYRQAE